MRLSTEQLISFLKTKSISCFVVLLALVPSLTVRAAAPIEREFSRPDLAHGTQTLSPAVRIFLGAHCEVWIFKDILGRDENRFRDALERVGAEFEGIIHPKVHQILEIQSKSPKTILLFDNIQDESFHRGHRFGKQYKGLFSPAKLGESTVLLDTNLDWQGLKKVYADIVHEYIHLLQYQLDPLELPFVNEGIALLFEQYLYGVVHLHSVVEFMNHPTRSLTDFSKRAAEDYGQTFLFFSYLDAHFGGKKLIREIMVSNEHGVESIDNALKKSNDHGFHFAFRHFAFALLLNTSYFSTEELFSLRNATGYNAPVPKLTQGEIQLPKTSVAAYWIPKGTQDIRARIPPDTLSYYLWFGKDEELVIEDLKSGTRPPDVESNLFLVLVNVD